MRPVLVLVIAFLSFGLGCVPFRLTGKDEEREASTTRPSSNQVRSVALSAFDGVRIEDAIDATVKIGTTSELHIDADPSILASVKAEVNDGLLRIWVDKSIRKGRVRVTVTTPELRKVYSTEASTVTIEDWTAGSVALRAVGASTIEADGMWGKASISLDGASHAVVGGQNLSSLVCAVTGGSELTITGDSEKSSFFARGASTIDAEELKVGNAHVDIRDASTLRVFAIQKLTGLATSASNVVVIGSPKSSSLTTEGASTTTTEN